MLILPQHTVVRPHGVAYTTPDGGAVVERDVLVCGHCQYAWQVIPGSGRRRGWCRRCQEPLCGKPGCMAGCRPWEAALEAMERGG